MFHGPSCFYLCKLMCNVLFFSFQPFLYQLGYFIFSVLGNYNYFFFAAHLLDVAVGVAALKIILQAITHNGKELVLTLMLLSIIVYIYTVIAFNFFRQFYVSGEDEEESKMCHDMLTVSNQKNEVKAILKFCHVMSYILLI